MKTQEIIQTGGQVFAPTYAQFPIVLESGEGCTVTDSDGKEYLDFVAGIAVNALGYGHTGLTAALEKVLQGGILHCSNLYWNNYAIQAAQNLVELSGLKNVFFCNSGAEANEAALKLARKYGHKHKSPNANKIISMANSFHGRTYGAVTATGQQKYHKNFAPMMPDITYAEFNDLESVKSLIDSRTCAILIEPIQGEGGIRPAEQAFLKGVRDLCDEHDILLIFDEVQCGMGRTGLPFAYQQFGVKPDAVSLAKALGAGVPTGALVIGEKAADTFEPGDHASTFGGNFLAGAAAGYMTSLLKSHGFLAAIQESSRLLKDMLLGMASTYPSLVKEVRGMGLMMGMELTREVKPVIAGCLEKGLLLVGSGTHVVRFVPPLVVSTEEVKTAMHILESVLKDYC